MKQVVVIGAGPAGLTAAYELLSEPEAYDVTILEESQEIGGISRTVRHNGNRMDIGGHRFFSKDSRVTAWWETIMPMQGAPAMDDKILGREKPLRPGGPDPETTDAVMLVRDRVSRIYYLRHFFDYPISLKFATFRNMGLRRTIKAGFSYLHSVFHKLSEDSLENFYINRFGRVLYSMFFEGYTEKLWGRHPRDIAADWGAQRVKGLSIGAVLKDVFRRLLPHKQNKKVETSLIEQFSYPKYGPGQLWEAVAAEIIKRGGRIRLGCRVTELNTDSGHISSLCCETAEGKETIPADIVLSSMPVRDLVAGLRGTVVPSRVAQAASTLPYRDFVTVGLLVDKLNLRNQTKHKTLGNLVPDCWIYVQEPEVKMGRIQIFNNWSPYMVKDPEHTVWIGLEYFCTEGDDFWNMDEAECAAFAERELISMDIISPGAVKDCHRERVKKAYPAYFDGYKDMPAVIDFLDGFDNLYCIGRNGQHRYNNMDHSMVTAFEAVANIRSGKVSRENIWSVNTEESYHEEKSAE